MAQLRGLLSKPTPERTWELILSDEEFATVMVALEALDSDSSTFKALNGISIADNVRLGDIPSYVSPFGFAMRFKRGG